VDVKYPEDFYKVENISKDFLDTMEANEYISYQKINGENYIKMTPKYFEEFGEYIQENIRAICVGYWERIIKDTQGQGIMDLVKRICYTHAFIKKITNGEIDFCEEIGEELNG
jgi:hypothetical protein